MSLERSLDLVRDLEQLFRRADLRMVRIARHGDEEDGEVWHGDALRGGTVITLSSPTLRGLFDELIALATPRSPRCIIGECGAPQLPGHRICGTHARDGLALEADARVAEVMK